MLPEFSEFLYFSYLGIALTQRFFVRAYNLEIRYGGSRVVRSKDKPGFYKGKHFTEYVEEVKSLVRENKLNDAENLLLALVSATESESKFGVAPWYYEKLAIIYRKKKDLNAEIGILERYFAVQTVSVTSSSKLLARLEKLKA